MNDWQAFSLNRFRLLLGLVLAGTFVAGSVWWSRHVLAHHGMPRGGSPFGDTSDLGRDRPLAIGPSSLKLLPASEAEREAICSRLDFLSREKPTSSLCLHLLRIHGPAAVVDAGESGEPVKLLDALTDATASKAFFGSVALERTRHGARYPTALRDPLNADAAQESHRDQCLAAFAELGLPLSTPLRIEGEALALRDVLRDSIAEFHLWQSEITWTAVAYALYLPPQSEWQNRYGERASFDDIVHELLGRPFDKASCAGAHLLYSMIVMARADAQIPVLSDGTRKRLWDQLENAARALAATQEPDGGWRGDWYRGVAGVALKGDSFVDPTDVHSRLVATGHLTECLLYVPAELQLAKDCLRRAGLWLQSALRAASAEDLKQDFCPYTHAICAVRQMMFMGSEPSRLDGHRDR